MDDLLRVYSQQHEYNNHLQLLRPQTREAWAQKYLLGLTSEVAEVLREIRWRVHRMDPRRNTDKVGLALELADVMKYCFCLFQNWDFTAEDMLHWVAEKGEILEFRHKQEFTPAPVGRRVIVSDLDGTLADWRGGLLEWSGLDAAKDPESSLSLDVDMGWSYPEYRAKREEFERSGGLAKLPPYWDGIEAVRRWKEEGCYLVMVTARPLHITRVWYDTYSWLREYDILPDSLQFMTDERIQLCIDLSRKNKVLLLDDDPHMAMRAAANNITAIVRARDYNRSLGIAIGTHRTDDFNAFKIAHPELP